MKNPTRKDGTAYFNYCRIIRGHEPKKVKPLITKRYVLSQRSTRRSDCSFRLIWA